MTVLAWILGGAGLWVVASAVLSFVMGRLIRQGQSERDSYAELRATRSAPEPAPARAPEPETSPLPLAMPRQQAAPPLAPFTRPRIPQPRPQPHLPCATERPASRG